MYKYALNQDKAFKNIVQMFTKCFTLYIRIVPFSMYNYQIHCWYCVFRLHNMTQSITTMFLSLTSGHIPCFSRKSLIKLKPVILKFLKL